MHGPSPAARGRAPGTAAPSRSMNTRMQNSRERQRQQKGRAPAGSSRLAGAETSTSAAVAMARPAPCTMQAEQHDARRHERERLAGDIADRRPGYQEGAHHGGKADGDENERQDDGEVGRTHASRGAQRIVLGQHEERHPEGQEQASGEQIPGIAQTHRKSPEDRSRVENLSDHSCGVRFGFQHRRVRQHRVPTRSHLQCTAARRMAARKDDPSNALTYAWPTATFLASKCLGPAQSHRFHVTCSAISRVAWLSVQSRS